MRANRAANRCRYLFARTYERKQVGDAAGRTRGVPRNSQGLLETCTEAVEQKQRENKNRERSSEIGSAALRPPHARCLSSSSSSSFYRSKRGRSEFNSSPTKSNRFDPRMYLIRPYVLLGARVCEEPVPTPWCSNSTLGRFSSRQRSPKHMAYLSFASQNPFPLKPSTGASSRQVQLLKLQSP